MQLSYEIFDELKYNKERGDVKLKSEDKDCSLAE